MRHAWRQKLKGSDSSDPSVNFVFCGYGAANNTRFEHVVKELWFCRRFCVTQIYVILQLEYTSSYNV